jgi:hypothetical protein
MARWLVALIGAFVVAACGGSTDEDGSGGSSGSGGSAGTGGSTGGNGGSGGSTGGSGGSTGGSAGSGPTCGGVLGEPCPTGQWCNYTPDSCGTADQTGTCEPMPSGCDLLYAPVCGCDGAVHGNACSAQSAGVDVNAAGGCTPPPDLFGCGPMFCNGTTDYCEQIFDDTGQPPAYMCKPLPAACVGSADCACFPDNIPCVELCDVVFGNGPYGFVLTCPGG